MPIHGSKMTARHAILTGILAGFPCIVILCGMSAAWGMQPEAWADKAPSLNGAPSLDNGVLPGSGAAPVLSARINYAALVPDALLGHWSRTRYIERSSAHEMVDRTETGIWIIVRRNDRILLRNPDSGAETEATVDSVVDKTAVFHFDRQLPNGFRCHEQLSLTPENNGAELRGYQIKECYRPAADSPDGFEPYYQAVARVKGTRRQDLKALTE